MRRYAEGTTTSVDSTQSEMRALLRKHGAQHFALAEGPASQAVEFILGGVRYRFAVEVPDRDWALGEVTRRANGRSMDATIAAKVQAEWRRRWRARLLWLKATLEFAEGEDAAELVHVLGAFAVLENGHTVGEALASGTVRLLGAGT